jgi:hypothetical protein
MLQVSRVPGRACVVKTGGDGYRSAGPECRWKKKGDFFLLKHGQKFYISNPFITKEFKRMQS